MNKQQIIYMDNKPYIKYDVVMLPTKNESSLWINCENKLKIHIKDMMCPGKQESQHLYIISDEEIKEGDWVSDDIEIIQASSKLVKAQTLINRREWKKIIATTDKSLSINMYDINGVREVNFDITLPQPSRQFIEKYIEEYNKGNIITEVLVEVILDEWKSNDFRPVIFHNIDRLLELGYNPKCNFTFKKGGLKLDSQNQVTIRKQKDSWSREEVVALCKSAYNTGFKQFRQIQKEQPTISFEEWIEENL